MPQHRSCVVVTGVWRGGGSGRSAGPRPAALGAAEAAWHTPACSSPEGLPVWAAAQAGVSCMWSTFILASFQVEANKEKSMVFSSPSVFLFACGGGLLSSCSFQSVRRARISRGSELPWPGVEVCQQWLENIYMCRPCVMINVQGIWASASEEERTRALQISPLIIIACSFLPQVVHQMPAARLRKRMQTRHVK